MKLQQGDVILVRMAFHQAAGGKVRPSVVILDTGDDDIVAAPITSRPQFSLFDMPIHEWRTAGLNVPSFARLHKLTVLAKAGVVKHLGRLAPQDLLVFADKLALVLKG